MIFRVGMSRRWCRGPWILVIVLVGDRVIGRGHCFINNNLDRRRRRCGSPWVFVIMLCRDWLVVDGGLRVNASILFTGWFTNPEIGSGPLIVIVALAISHYLVQTFWRLVNYWCRRLNWSWGKKRNSFIVIVP